MGCSLSFDFCDYVTTIRRLSSDYRLSGLSTFGRLSDYLATIDFATISDFGDFRAAGGDLCRGLGRCACGDIRRLYIWGLLADTEAVPSWTCHGGTVRRCRMPFSAVLGRSDGVSAAGHIVYRVSRSVRCATCTRQTHGVRFCVTVPELSQIVRVSLYSPQDARKRWRRVSCAAGTQNSRQTARDDRMTARKKPGLLRAGVIC